MQAGDPHVVDAAHFVAHELRRDGGLLRDRKIARPGGYDGDDTGTFGEGLVFPGEAAGSFVMSVQGKDVNFDTVEWPDGVDRDYHRGNVDTGPNYKLDKITFQITDVSRFQEAIEQTRLLLEATHRGIQDFTFYTREDSIEAMEQSIKSIRVILGLIAGICLVVGGIGIANIMLASITERIREIGVRRAIGAKARDIFVQVIVESTVIGVCGGLLGLAAAFGLLGVIAKLTESEYTPVVAPGGVLISFGFAVVIGIVARGWQAARLVRPAPRRNHPLDPPYPRTVTGPHDR